MRRSIDFPSDPLHSSRDALCLEHQALAWRLAARYARRGEPVDDLRQVAMLALLKAADRFDPAREVLFSTYASRVITGELKRHFRDRTWTVRVGRTLQELYLRTRSATEFLRGELGRSPTITELAAYLEVSEEAVLEAMEVDHAYRPGSLDAPVRSDGSGRPLVIEVGAEDPGLSALVEQVGNDGLVSHLLGRLGPDDRALVERYFFEGRTQTEIAEEYGLTQVRVSRRLARIIGRLRALAVAEQLDVAS